MPIDVEYLRRHYASLSDDGLREIDGTDLVDEARRIYEAELAHRELAHPQAKKGRPGPGVAVPPLHPPEDADEEALDEELDFAPDEDPDKDQDEDQDDDLDGGPEPDWLGDAACAASFVSQPGDNSAHDAVEARDALEAAGVPCYLSTVQVEPRQASTEPQDEFRLMVPGISRPEAESVLDKEIFNREVEAQWRAHFQMLSDDELRAVDLEVLFAGLRDRIERVTGAYREELAQRGTE